MRPTREIMDLHVTKRAEEASNTWWQAHLWYGYQRGRRRRYIRSDWKVPELRTFPKPSSFPPGSNRMKTPFLPWTSSSSSLSSTSVPTSYSYSFRLFFSTTLRVHDTHLFLTNFSDSLMAVPSPTTTAWRAHCLLTVTHLLWPWCTGDRLL